MLLLWELSEGFGFNTDVLETNVLNLAVVIFFLIKVGGDTIPDILESRRARLVQSVESAQARFDEAQEALQRAREQASALQQQARDVTANTQTELDNVCSRLKSDSAAKVTRLEQSYTSALALRQQTQEEQIKQRILDGTCAKIFAKLSQILNNQPEMRTKVFSTQLTLFKGALKEHPPEV
jgi:F-type H+-transporting ATPase subunit b